MSRVDGIPVSSLEQSSEFMSSDVMLLARRLDLSGTFSENASFDVQTLVSQLVNDNDMSSRIGTMSFHESSDYSDVNHDHDYVYCRSSFDPVQTDGTKIAEFV